MSSIIQMINELRSLKTLFHEKKSFFGIFKSNKSDSIRDNLAEGFRIDQVKEIELAVLDIHEKMQFSPCIFNQHVQESQYRKTNDIYAYWAHFYCASILNNPKIEKGDKLNLISMIEFLKLRDKGAINPYYNGFEKLPEEFHVKVAAAIIWSGMKHLDLSMTLKIIGDILDKSSSVRTIMHSEFEAFIKYIFGYFGISITKDFGRAIFWYEKHIDEYIKYGSSRSAHDRGKIDVEKLESYHWKDEIQDKFSLYLGVIIAKEFLSTQSRYARSNFWNDMQSEVVNSKDWTEQQVEFFFSILEKLNWKFKLDKDVENQVLAVLNSTKKEELVGNMVAYYNGQHNNLKNENLRKGTAKYYRESQSGISWEKKLQSGFGDVEMPQMHNPYSGLHPNQMRPFFTVIGKVANVDIIKFYKKNNMQHVKFRINDNTHELAVEDGFGFDFMDAFNLLLFQEGIPYQFIVIRRRGNNPSNYSQSPNTYTILNEVEYNQLKSNIQQHRVAGWAPVKEELVYFNTHISELKPAKSNPNFDSVDINRDPKFITLNKEISKLQPNEKWSALIMHLMICPLSSNPGKRWISKSKELIEDLGKDSFIKGSLSLISGMLKGDEWFLDDEKFCGLKGLTWVLRFYPSKDSIYMLKTIIEKAYRKVPGGPLNAKLGNVGLEGLAHIGSKEAYGAAGTMLAKSKYSVFQRAIKSRMKKFKALLSEFTATELEDMVVPHFDIQDNVRTVNIGDYQALINVSEKGIITTWSKDGKITKSAPKDVRDNFPLELKSVRADIKSIKDCMIAQGKRLESSYIQERTWTKAAWNEYIMNHSMMSILAGKLIWCVNEKHEITFTIDNGSLINHKKEVVQINGSDIIRLWHPALSDVATVVNWRDYFFENEITQPFKQAFREVYLLTPAEERTFDHSMRFAGHHLKGNTLYSLGKTRQWKMTYDQAPEFYFPNRNMVAILDIIGGVLYSNCVTNELLFKEARDEKGRMSAYNSPKLSLKEVPPVLLSEVMRDVDLFVAVSGVAYDPYFNNTGDKELMGYWQAAAFGRMSETPLSEVRKDLLQRLLPKTKVKNHFNFDGNFLVIKGKLHSYKINLGSSNILIQPSDKYLCIVPGRTADKMTKKIWLPFEGGDSTLMTIISKAFLLFDDDKITEVDITSQL